MSKCDTCKKTGCFHRSSTVVGCSQYVAKDKTNADRIREMSDEDLAEFIRDVSYECQDAYCGYHCPMCAYPWCNSRKTLEWLKQPAEGE